MKPLSLSALCISSASFLIECCFHSFLPALAIVDVIAELHRFLVLDGAVPQLWLNAVWHPGSGLVRYAFCFSELRMPAIELQKFTTTADTPLLRFSIL